MDRLERDYNKDASGYDILELHICALCSENILLSNFDCIDRESLLETILLVGCVLGTEIGFY